MRCWHVPAQMACHNKSSRTDLVISTQDEDKQSAWRRALDTASKKPYDGLAEEPCLVMTAGDGRVSVGGHKNVFGYQVVAREKFGPAAMQRLQSVKSTKDTTVISHLCGTRNCLVADHLFLEGKGVNDERTMCHFAMRNVRAKSGKEGVAKAMALGLCCHAPPCASSDKVNLTNAMRDGRKWGMRAHCTIVNCRDDLVTPHTRRLLGQPAVQQGWQARIVKVVRR